MVQPTLFRLRLLGLPLCFVLLPQAARAQTEVCGTTTSCLDCLNQDGCDAWSVGTCFESCDNAPLDVGCYSSENFDGMAPEEICTKHDNDKADTELCSSQSGCGSCVDTVLSDGSSCQWFGELGFCGSGCGFIGCGVTTCETPPPPSASSECGAAATCLDCMNQVGCDAWSVGRCFPSCSNAPADVRCYRFDGMAPEEICTEYDNDKADTELCSSQSGCDSCVATVLLDGSSCEWCDKLEFCGSRGWGFMGCGVTTCEAPPPLSEAPSEAPLPSECGGAATCLDCLNQVGCDAWSVGMCFESCDNTPMDVGCYSSENFDGMAPEEICTKNDNDKANTELCSSQTECSSCVDTVMSDGDRSCQWFEDGGYCGSGCGMNGRGVTTCRDATTIGCAAAATCMDCLDQDGCDAWSVATCFESCDDAPLDVTCYRTERQGLTVGEICVQEAEDAADASLCSNQIDCGSCVDTVLSDGSDSCHWLEDGGYCASGCGVNGGCGVDSCPDPCGADISCEACIDEACAWSPELGCMQSCDTSAVVSCFSGDDLVVSEVCNATSSGRKSNAISIVVVLSSALPLLQWIQAYTLLL
jgi:hypothetical protein